LLILPDGRQLVAEGSYSAVRARGFLSKKSRQARQQKIREIAGQTITAVKSTARKVVTTVREKIQEANSCIEGIKNFNNKNIPAYRPGRNAFANFAYTAKGESMANTYLLAYLATLVYPEYLLEADPQSVPREHCEEGKTCSAAINAKRKQLHTNPQAFIDKYSELTRQLFGGDRVEYTWVHGYEDRSIFNEQSKLNKHNLNYDPEAMVISTSKAVFVVFRGTDKIGDAYDSKLTEWIATDFNALPVKPDDLPGQVHKGFWNSMKAPTKVYRLGEAEEKDWSGHFRDRLLAQVKANGGRVKHVWITGHSLGGGHAQLFAAFLANNGIVAKGVYTFESPQVGNSQFADYLDRTFPNDRLQRFEFKSDPVTHFPIRFARAGTRVFSSNVNNVMFDRHEARVIEAVAAGGGLLGGGATMGESLCFHYPHWDLVAAFNQLPPAVQQKMPSHLGIPTKNFFACNIANINLGKGCNPPI
jgi:hypothetical protein